MARIGLMNGRADDGAAIELFHPLFDLRRRVVRPREGHIEIGLGGVFFKGAWGIH